MKKKKIILGLISSIMLCIVGFYRVFFDPFSSMSLIVAYMFGIGGLIGAIANTLSLLKMRT